VGALHATAEVSIVFGVHGKVLAVSKGRTLTGWKSQLTSKHIPKQAPDICAIMYAIPAKMPWCPLQRNRECVVVIWQLHHFQVTTRQRPWQHRHPPDHGGNSHRRIQMSPRDVCRQVHCRMKHTICSCHDSMPSNSVASTMARVGDLRS